ncbi:uncharacterized protein DUF3298 [Marinirhabdus gelatinilytica]|uniref:Uncharacterized protein DUF3298 n=2 Tax=Marinirhabdus gelatinilytica TaxID=1703343 RepID=A0A370QB47_9FLAO|nr:uncharacterized protein DUF3298 [Marinirhabdus gelatinilytica]
MFDKVFISYAKEDYKFAEQLYDFLETTNYNPWLDKKKILPGQDWNFILRKELRDSDFIILLLSKTSVQKRGYIQREFKLALEYYEEKLDDDIFLIPVKIDDCEVPLKLGKFQWVEYLNGFESILKAMNLQRKKHIDIEQSKLSSNDTFEFEEINEKLNYEAEIKLDIQVNFIQFLNKKNSDINDINHIIKGRKAESIAFVRKLFFEIDGKPIKHKFTTPDWNLDLSYNSNLISKSIISISENQYKYFGGAHGSGIITGLNFRLNPLLKLDIEDLFDNDDEKKVLNLFSHFCFEVLKKEAVEFFNYDENVKDEDLFWEGSLSPKWENFQHFLITKKGLEIIFNDYSVSAYAFGVRFVEIPFDKIIQ